MEFIAAVLLLFFGINLWIIGRYLFTKIAKNKYLDVRRHLFTLDVCDTKEIIMFSTLGIAVYFLVLLLVEKPLTINLNENTWSFFQVVMAAGILAPLFEELVYRGILFGSLLVLIKQIFKKNPEPVIWVAFIVHTFIFMYMHDGLLFDLPRLAAGLLFGLLYMKYRFNLLPGIIAHISYNLMVITMWFFFWT